MREVVPSSYFTFPNCEKNIRINIFKTDPPLIFVFLVLSVHIPLVLLHI